MPSTTFSQLEMELSKRDSGGYSLAFRFRACGSDADNRTDRFPFELDKPGLKRLFEEAEIGVYGDTLTRQIFSDEQALQKWSDYFTSAQRLNSPLRIQLTVSENAPELHEIVWETLCNPENDQILTTDENIWFSRYLPSQDRRPVQPGGLENLQMVAAAANPINLVDYKFAPVDVDGEIERACRPFNVVKPLILPRGSRKVTLQNLLDEIRSGIDVVYLACHGYLVNGKPILILEDDQGKLSRISGTEFVDEIKKLAKLPHLMVFASCESAGKQHAGALSALGPMLAHAGVPAVLAMHGKISMETVEIFTPAFFREVQRDGQIDRALAVARNATKNRCDFWVPALFLRSESGKLWQIKKTVVLSKRPVPWLLPHTPNRKVQEEHLAEILAQRRETENRPVVTVVYGNEDQGQVYFFKRLVKVSIPYILSLDTNRNPLTEYELRWPEGLQSLKDLDRRLGNNLADVALHRMHAPIDEIQDALARLPGPLVVQTHVPMDDWKRFGLSALHSYLDFWQKWPNIHPRQDLFVFLFVKYPRMNGNWVSLWANWKNQRRCGELQRFSFEPYSRLTCAALPQLENVTRDQAEEWARQKEPQEFCDLQELLIKIREIFMPCGGQMPMETLALKLMDVLHASQREELYS